MEQRPLAITQEQQFQAEWNELLLAELRAIRELLTPKKEEIPHVDESQRSPRRERK